MTKRILKDLRSFQVFTIRRRRRRLSRIQSKESPRLGKARTKERGNISFVARRVTRRRNASFT